MSPNIPSTGFRGTLRYLATNSKRSLNVRPCIDDPWSRPIGFPGTHGARDRSAPPLFCDRGAGAVGVMPDAGNARRMSRDINGGDNANDRPLTDDGNRDADPRSDASEGGLADGGVGGKRELHRQRRRLAGQSRNFEDRPHLRHPRRIFGRRGRNRRLRIDRSAHLIAGHRADQCSLPELQRAEGRHPYHRRHQLRR
jgi:hypothetical protein